MTTPKKRRIKRGKITHISLCRRGMNQMPVLMKSGGRVQLELLTKVEPEGLLHALVYVPEENGEVAVDAEGDTAPRAVVKQMAHDFLSDMFESGGGIDIEHNLQVLGPDKVKIAETFLVQKNDERFQGWTDYQGRDVDPEGSWGMILKVLDPELRAAAESGELNGVSMFGNAEVELLHKNTPTPTPKKIMDEKQMQALCEMLTKSLAAALTPAKPEPKSQPEPVPFDGDPLDQADLAKHMDKVMLASLDLSKPADLIKWQAHVAKRQAENETPEAKLEKAQAELKKAQANLAKIQKSSNAPADPAPGAGPETPGVGMQKSESDNFAAGKKAVQALGLGKTAAK